MAADLPLAQAPIFGKTFKYEKRFEKPEGIHRDGFLFKFHKDGSFDYSADHSIVAPAPAPAASSSEVTMVSSAPPKAEIVLSSAPTATTKGKWRMEGKKIILEWERDLEDASLKRPVSDLYAKLKYTKCASVKAAPRKFHEVPNA